MKAHILQHVPFEDIGHIAEWLNSHRAEITYTRFFAGDSLPPPQSLDLVVVMGGPMSVNDESTLPWLRAEKDFIRNVLELDIPIVGICLGAQLIASALGARVYRNSNKEIGWFPVVSMPSEKDSFGFPAQFEAFHWHGETFDLPEGAMHLACSAGCNHQAFQIGNRAIGVQFHLETTPESLRSLIENCRDELTPGTYIQTEQQMLKYPASGYDRTHILMDRLLRYITRTSG